MRLLVNRTLLGTTLAWSQRLLLAAGICLLGYCAFVVVDTWTFQQRESAIFEAARDISPSAVTPGDPAAAIGLDGFIGRIAIPRLNISVIVMEGTASRTLRRAAGHIQGTALPGQSGNIGISAHRDTFFRPLRNIRADDIIALETTSGEFRYRVVSTKIVNPEDLSVLDSNASQVLTLVTCYPFYFVGPAPSRFIVRAERVS